MGKQFFSGSYRRVRGFTLVELLVVIAIIGILIGMLLPAVQQVREAARRTDCANRIKQIGLAMHNFESQWKHYPPAYISEGTRPGWSWGTFILPFIDQEPLYDLGNSVETLFGGGANPAAETTEYSTTPLPAFRCPSDLGESINDIRLSHATSNYRAVAGPHREPYFYENLDMGGVLYQNSRTRFTRITDGTSNTVVVGECMFDKSVDKRAAIWPGMSGLRGGAVWISDVMWWIDETTAVINGPAPQAFSSRHPGGAMFVFCDGSTRFFFEGGDVNLLRYLGGRDDGQLVDPEF